MYLRNRHLLLVDALLLMAAPLLAYAARFEGFDWTSQDAHAALVYTLCSLPLKLGIYYAMGLYTRLWRRAGVADVVQLVWAQAASAATCAFVGIVVLPVAGATQLRVPISVMLMDALFTMTLFTLPRLIAKAMDGRRQTKRRGNERRALIVGAGAAGELVAKEMFGNPHLGLVPIGFVDDDPRKQNLRIGGLPVLGTLNEIAQVALRERVGELVVAMPRASGAVVRRAVRVAMDLGLPTRTVPGLFDILSGRAGVSALRKVEIQDLLRREPVTTDLDAVRATVAGHTILVTGAGGSIGSELCRQLAAFAPARIILLGHGENSIFDIQNELRARFPTRTFVPVIADIRDGARIRRIFDQYAPSTVFHAAAHKHVPLMEENIVEAVTNNVLGTRNVVEASAASGCERVVLISTDKAVRPTSAMGATKRVAELVVQHAARQFRRKYLAVRFGNVLGSRGSVVPTFLKQIEQGGPVTITDREMTRFFMTIPEAVQLVLQASVMGEGGEVFALDMGEPVKIVDLASDLIRLSGLEVGVDIEIEVTGKRPGEKLFEEVFFRGESVTPTSHPKLLRALLDEPAPDTSLAVSSLINATLASRSDSAVRELLAGLVPDYVGASASSTPARAPQWITSLGSDTAVPRISMSDSATTAEADAGSLSVSIAAQAMNSERASVGRASGDRPPGEPVVIDLTSTEHASRLGALHVDPLTPRARQAD
jgi:FlaA1/EpsC-like NDP-sugar epimerase